MKIIIVGDGKVGRTFAQQLSQAGHDVTIIDRQASALQHTSESLDIMSIQGNGATLAIQQEAGVEQADLLIAATDTDEQNLFTCLIAKRAGAKHTIARVRSPEYTREISLIREDLGLSLAINPELACATEMARVLRFPSAVKIDTFAGGKVEILKHLIGPASPLVGIRLMDLNKFKANVLICAVERGKEVLIPNGSFTLAAGDRISIVAQPRDASLFFRKIGAPVSPARRIMLIGGGRIAFYLASQMADFGADVKIIEENGTVCKALAALLPGVTVIHGDGTDHQLLSQEGIEEMDAVATLTGLDELNILMSLYAGQVSKAKIITKINRDSYEDIVENMDIGSVFYPRYIAAEVVVRYVRAMENSAGSNVEALYSIVGDKAEALEFRVSRGSKVCGIPLQDLCTRPGILFGSIFRRGRAFIPRGQDTIEPGDTVVVVTTLPNLNDLDDILERRR
ncbi:MAG: Trk system potassium transporter TrkA [Candidatus Faecousia sp.]|nr:Trk system potassium transporter TrkA [Clostridiales bacterium]MDY4220542.1 Trk system potassium transporter TrkA [Candidatus Faecousia sp.]